MSNVKKIIYTDGAKDRLERLNLDVKKRIDQYFRDSKYVPGDDFIEITASDIDDVARRMKIVKQASIKYSRLIPPLYSIAGALLLTYGIFYNQIEALLKDAPERLLMITSGGMLIIMSWIYLYILKLRDKRNEMERISIEDRPIQTEAMENVRDIVMRLSRDIPVPSNDVKISTHDALVLQDRPIIIHSAKYFFDRNYLNVTARIKELVNNGIHEFTVTNDLMGGDPAAGKIKTLEIHYSVDGKEKKTSGSEGALFKLEI